MEKKLLLKREKNIVTNILLWKAKYLASKFLLKIEKFFNYNFKNVSSLWTVSKK